MTQQSNSPSRTPQSALTQSQLEGNHSTRFEGVKRHCVDCQVPVHIPMLEKWKLKGYHLESDTVSSSSEFQAIYELFDQIFGAGANSQLLDLMSSEADLWMSLPGNAHMLSEAPVGHRDRRTRADKAQKSYYHYTKDFGRFVRGIGASSAKQSPVIRAFSQNLDIVVDQSEKVFRKVLASVSATTGSIATAMLEMQELPILLKLLAYYPDSSPATSRHYDKSLLTCVLNASDLENDRFLICSNPAWGACEDMATPNRQVGNRFMPGKAVVFPGAVWRKLGVESILPSPHMVQPVDQKQPRYSTIAFLLAPGVDMSDIVTSH